MALARAHARSAPQGPATIVARLVNACWYVFKIGVAVALVCGAATAVYMYVRMDDEIRRHVEAQLAERYPHLLVRVGGARIIEGQGIAIYDVTIADPAAPPGGDELLAADELLLACDAELLKLVGGAPEVERVEIKQPRIAARRDRTGRWNLAALIPAKPAAMKLPQIIIRGGALSVSDEAAPQTPPLAFRDVHLNLTPLPTGADSASPAQSAPIGFRATGSIGGSQAKQIKVIDATIAGVPWRGAVQLEIDEFQLNPALLAWVQPFVPARLRSARLTGALDGQVELAWNGLPGRPDIRANLALVGGRLEDPRLPAPVTDLTGQLTIDGDRQELNNLTGKCSGATVAASLHRTGWDLRAPLALSTRAENVTLDTALYRTLATAASEGIPVADVLCEQWDKFRPAGIVDATLTGQYDGTTWTPTATLTGRGLSFESDKFASETSAYRLTGGSGTIACLPAEGQLPKRIEIKLQAFSGQQPLQITGQVIDPKPGAAGWLEIKGENVEINQGILDSIPNPKCREVIAELRPAGRFHVYWRLDRPRPDEAPETNLRLDLTDIRINYARFEYPLRGIRGVITARNNDWHFQDLVSAGRRPVRGRGRLQPVGDGQFELNLEIFAEQAALDDTLYQAVQPNVQQAWAALRPWGNSDITAYVNYSTGQPRPSISVVLEPRAAMQIRPEFFPYLMEEVSGKVTYRDGAVELQGMRARNDRTVISTNGSGSFGPDGQWTFTLSGLTADHVWPGPELVSAFHPKVRAIIERLRPTGNFRVHDGLMTFTKAASEIAPLEASWDIVLDCHQTDLQCGIELKNIAGSVRLQGHSDGVRGYSSGRLALESVTIQDIHFTDVRGPLWVNDSKCLLGKWAIQQERLQQGQQQLLPANQMALPEEPITGRVYDGYMKGHAWVTFDNLPVYVADLALQGADLRRIFVERFHGQRQFNGKVDADMVVGGSGDKLEMLNGEGHVFIRDADLYELSLLASLLKILRTGDSGKTAFTQSNVAFRVQGRHIVLDKIDFLGDVVNLYGNGETDLDQNIALTFNASILPHDSRLPLVNNFVKQANPRMVQMYVNGTLSEPKVTTEAFPGIAQWAQQLGSDLRNPAAAVEEMQAERRRVAAQQQLDATRQ